jgi:D-tyrosyl-tRNA(Tyr) deacylase
MRAIVQRVSQAHVAVSGSIVGEIGLGLLIFVAVHRDDSDEKANRLASKILRLRIFPDESGKMNLSAFDIQASLLIVSQFTLYGNTAKGNRPSYDQAAAPEKALRLYKRFIDECVKSGLKIETGQFQAHMNVHLVNDGPVTLLCDTES